jgi:hypothetical protein
MHPIVAGLLKFVRKIGRWLLDVAARRGGKWLADYLEERVGVFRARLARVVKRTAAAAKRRALWLKGRIARWLAAAKWLRENAAQVDDKAIAIVRELPAVKRLADVVPDEVEPKAAA